MIIEVEPSFILCGGSSLPARARPLRAIEQRHA
jgi:hypothetical protein